MPLTTRRFALSREEWATTAVAAVLSSAAYAAGGHTYLARGVVGDLAGFAVLGVAALAAGARVRHEAAVCLVAIGAVVAASPDWPLQVAEPVWWAAFAAGLTGYLLVRKRVCD